MKANKIEKEPLTAEMRTALLFGVLFVVIMLGWTGCTIDVNQKILESYTACIEAGHLPEPCSLGSAKYY